MLAEKWASTQHGRYVLSRSLPKINTRQKGRRIIGCAYQEANSEGTYTYLPYHLDYATTQCILPKFAIIRPCIPEWQGSEWTVCRHAFFQARMGERDGNGLNVLENDCICARVGIDRL